MALSIPTKNTGETLTATEFNELLAKVNEYDDRVWSSSDISDFAAAVSGNAAVTANTAKISATGNELEATDIDTLAKINAIITDATLIDTADARLSDARTPLSHSHVIGDVTGLQAALDGKQAAGSYLVATDIDTLAELNAIITDATLIDTTDSRLSDARTPTAHNHVAADITDFDTEVSNNASVVANTAKNTYPSGDATKVGFITVTQAVNLDTMESDIATNSSKVSADGSVGTHSDINKGTPAGSTASTLRIFADPNLDGTYDVIDWTPPTGGGGESNTASNLVGGDGIFAQKNGVDLEFKSLVAGTNITLTPAANTITIDAAGGGASQLTDLSDVSAAAPTSGNVLVGNGTTYAGRLLTEADISNLQSYLLPADIGVTVQAFSTVLQNTTASFLTADETKLDGIEAGATADQTGAEIKALYEAEANTNAFTDAEQTKLAGIEAGATADQTGAEIKALYEAEANTNAFTDAEQTKLAGIEAGATADQTATEINTALEGLLGAEYNDVPIEDTPTTVITLDNVMGRYSNLGSANTNTTFTTTGTTLGAFCKMLINAASEPTVTGATKLDGPAFQTSTNMYMIVQYMGATRGVEYWFSKITA